MSDLKNRLTCAGCGAILEFVYDVDGQKRDPCPNCGSTKRRYRMYAQPGVYVETAGDIQVSKRSLPEFLLQSIVLPGRQCPEGSLITAVAPAWKKIIGLLERDPELVFTIDARKWEEIIAAAYDEAGFDEVILTPRSGDLGRDVIAVKHGHFSVRFIEQVKAYGPGHRVPANDVRALLGVLQADQKTSKGIVTTTSEFAPKIAADPFIAPFVPNRLELVDGKQLIKKLADIANGHTV
jgi:restriction system protein